MLTRSQAAAAARRASRHPQADEMFHQGLMSVLKQWTALNLAVSHQWGGPRSEEKANALLDELMKTFQGPERIYKDDISLILEDIMESDFNTMLEDGSGDEVGELLVNMWGECSKGEFAMVHRIQEKERLRQASVGTIIARCQGLEGGDEIDSDEENDGLDADNVVEMFRKEIEGRFTETEGAVPLVAAGRLSHAFTSDATETMAPSRDGVSVLTECPDTSEEVFVERDPEGWEVAGKRKPKKKK